MAYGPNPSDVHVNRPMTAMSIAFLQKLGKFKADIVCPILPVDKKSDSYFVFDRKYWFSDLAKKRAIGAPAVRGGFGISQDSYLCELFGFGKPIDDQTRDNEDTPLNSDRNAMQFVTRIGAMRREKQFKDEIWGTGKWGIDLTGNASASNILGAQTFLNWDDDDATPIDDVEQMKIAGEKRTGFTFNSLSIGKPVWVALKKCPQILTRITGGSTSIDPAKVTVSLVASLLEVEELIIMDAVENTAGHGNEMEGDYIFGEQFFFQYKDTDMGPEVATACRTITWKRYAGAANGVRILKFRDETVHSDIIEIESCFVHKRVARDLGIFGSNVLST